MSREDYADMFERWEAEDTPLDWTRDKPTVPGRYAMSHDYCDVKADESGRLWLTTEENVLSPVDQWPRDWFYGPLPQVPEEVE